MSTQNSTPRHVSRRDALRWMFGAAATISALDFKAYGIPGLPTGIGSDPNLLKNEVPWPRVLTEDEIKTVIALCDTIIPADEKSPSASAIGVHDFINEWVSAPYEQQAHDCKIVRDGLVLIDQESTVRFQKRFAALNDDDKKKLCDEICSEEKVEAELKREAHFFAKFRDLTAGGFYTTPEGWRDLGYIGNIALTEFPGPPPEVLKHLGLA